MPDINEESFAVTLNMAKYDMSSLKLSYSGNADEDIKSFVSRFETYARLRDFTAPKKVLAFISCIDGHARIFLDSVPEDDKKTVEDIVKVLEHHFQGGTWRWGIQSKLLARSQLQGETLDSYASSIMVACRQLQKNDSEMQDIFIRGLLPELKAFVMSQKPESFQASFDAARLGCSIKLSSQGQSVVSVIQEAQPTMIQSNVNTALEQKLDTALSSVAGVMTKLEKMELQTKRPIPAVPPYFPPIPTPVRNHYRNHMTGRSTQNFKRTVVCHRCGRIGHKWRNCYSKRDSRGVPLND